MYRLDAVPPAVGAAALLAAAFALPLNPFASFALLIGAAVLGGLGFTRLLQHPTTGLPPGIMLQATAGTVLGAAFFAWLFSDTPGVF
ncbi:hypothetical protein AB0G74_30580 [Streptomyces sp. NPDC020875]|uniref:hypothetical protein n=1 Tax=Streptomyces sp. NPDC020875 TaxID=3154898 RepID=UPI0033C1E721